MSRDNVNFFNEWQQFYNWIEAQQNRPIFTDEWNEAEHYCTQPVEKKCEKCLSQVIAERKAEDERRENEEVMDARKWIEFGKMFNAMETEGWYLELVSFNDHEINEYDFEVYDEYGDDLVPCHNHRFQTPYAAIKHAYFTVYKNEPDYTDLQLDIEPGDLKRIQKMADDNGITVDEVIINILKDAIERT
jgi:hypothetical protein